MKVYRTTSVLIALAFGLLVARTVSSATLTTKSYVIVVTENCDDDVVCQHVSYVATNRITGQVTHLNGHAVAAIGADGVTPSHHQGYEFSKGKTEYFVADQGWLQIKRAGEVLLYEEGTWSDPD